MRTLHPSADQLAAFMAGRLGPTEQVETERHLESCADCLRKVQQLPDDSLLDYLRAGRTQRGEAAPSLTPAGADTQGPSGSVTAGGVDVIPALAEHPRYRVLRLLGAGGMGEVYHAVHKLMDREVALKVIHPTLTRNPRAVQRFLLEVKAAARLQHPNIVTAHDAEQLGEIHLLVMEYVEGISLDRLVAKNGPLPVEQAAHLVRQAALGLHHAHERGMVHRDIKPHNLMVTRKGQVKVLDFGLALLAQAEQEQEGEGKRPLTTLGMVLGTPDYISPEQVGDSHKVDSRADLYSLGCTLYFLLTGQPPFVEGSALQKALAHVDIDPVPLSRLRSEIPPELAQVVERMMAKRPADRYQTASAVAQALHPFTRTGQQAETRREAAEPGLVPLPASLPTPAPTPVPAARPVPARVQPRPAREADHPTPVSSPLPRRKPRRRRGRRGLVLLGVGLGFLGLALATGWIVHQRVQERWKHRGQAASGPGAISSETAGPAVLRGAGASASSGRVLVVLPARQYWNPDFSPAMAVLKAAGLSVRIAATDKQPIQPAPEGGGDAVQPDLLLCEAQPADYDAILFVGGTAMPAVLEAGAAAQQLTETMKAENRLIAGVCNGVGSLARTGVLKGHRGTCPPEMESILRNKGMQVVDQAVVEDGNVLTGRDPASAEALAQALVARLRR